MRGASFARTCAVATPASRAVGDRPTTRLSATATCSARSPARRQARRRRRSCSSHDVTDAAPHGGRSCARYADVVAHDLREPGREHGRARRAARAAARASRRRRRSLLLLRDGTVQRAAELIEAVLRVRARSGELDRRGRVALGGLVAASRRATSARALEATSATLERGELPAVDGDHVSCAGSLQNLVANAVKSAAAGPACARLGELRRRALGRSSVRGRRRRRPADSPALRAVRACGRAPPASRHRRSLPTAPRRRARRAQLRSQPRDVWRAASVRRHAPRASRSRRPSVAGAAQRRPPSTSATVRRRAELHPVLRRSCASRPAEPCQTTQPSTVYPLDLMSSSSSRFRTP